jgi:hypothetical protein
MLIPKNKQVEEIHNPLRPKIGHRSDVQKYRLTRYHLEVEPGEVEEVVMADFDHPELHKWCEGKGLYDDILERWYIDLEHEPELLTKINEIYHKSS